MSDWRKNLAYAQLALDQERVRDQARQHHPDTLDEINRERVAMSIRQDVWRNKFGVSQAQQFGEQQRKNIELKAKLDAENFEVRYTAKDKAAIAKLRNQGKQAYQMLMSGEITQDEYDKHSKILKSRELGVIPGELPSLSPYAKGQGIGETWKNAMGVHVRRDKDGIEVPIDFSKTAEGMAQEQELVATKEKAKLDAELEKEKRKYRVELAKMKVADANSESGQRFLRPEEINEYMERAYPSEKATFEDTPDNRVLVARKYISDIRSQYGSNPPPETIQAMQEALNIIRNAGQQ